MASGSGWIVSGPTGKETAQKSCWAALGAGLGRTRLLESRLGCWAEWAAWPNWAVGLAEKNKGGPDGPLEEARAAGSSRGSRTEGESERLGVHPRARGGFRKGAGSERECRGESSCGRIVRNWCMP
ncbi:hypothetical protein CRG98_000325 [Punica granatum]|uniref:Uncharacterized protein n=1 Tax=Punica granatum TaxID=22663 RepID=A0A2I0LF56_PUNGR|nr:hypothetical protein CRG98_000325 [Punica granatum]